MATRAQPRQFSAQERAILDALGKRIDAHPDPEVAMFMTAVERNLLMRCGDWIIWAADNDIAFRERVMAQLA